MSEHNFKVGDKVVVVKKSPTGSLPEGHVGKITQISDKNEVKVDDTFCGWFYGASGGRLEVINYPNKPHKHAELIKAWADGAVIEYFYSGVWRENGRPSWCEDGMYRIKPETTPEELEIAELETVIKNAQDRINKLEEKKQ